MLTVGELLAVRERARGLVHGAGPGHGGAPVAHQRADRRGVGGVLARRGRAAVHERDRLGESAERDDVDRAQDGPERRLPRLRRRRPSLQLRRHRSPGGDAAPRTCPP